MRTAVLGVCIVACGGDDTTVKSDGGVDPTADASIDAKVVNTSSIGLVQAANVAGAGQIAAGFYETPAGAAGCTWTFDGPCSIAECVSPGLSASSAGDVTMTFGTGSATLSPTAGNNYPFINRAVPIGDTITISAAGATVPAFQAAALVVPSPLAVTAPANGATFPRTSPLTITWTPATGDVYAAISQNLVGQTYPSLHERALRCRFDASTGTGNISAALVAKLEAGAVSAVVGAMAEDTLQAGPYDVVVRVLAIDAARALTAQ